MSERKYNGSGQAEDKPDKKSKNKYPENLYKAGNGKDWILDFTWKGERYRQVLGPLSRSVAKERARTIRSGVAESRIVVNGKRWTGTEWVVDAPKETINDVWLKEAIQQFLDWRAKERPKSQLLAKYNSKPVLEFFGSYRLSQVSPFLIDKYKIERRKTCACLKPKAEGKAVCCSECGERIRPLANATINRELMFLRHLFNKCVAWKLAASSPLEGIKLGKEISRCRYLAPEEAQKLLDACNDDFRPVVLTALHTGFRRSELASLRWSSVDMGQRTITVQSCYAKSAETRTVPMTDDVAATFEQLRRERDRGPEDLVFVSRYGKPWKSWRTAFENARERAGIRDFRFHDLRHCYASFLAMNNTNSKALMELLGHKDLKMTARYSHLSDDYKHQAVAKLPRFSGEGTENPASEAPRIPPQVSERKVVGFGK